MKKIKGIISLSLSILLVTTLSFSTYGNSVKALELTKQKKISSVLLKELDNLKTNETVPIYVELKDNISKEYLEQKVDAKTGMTIEQLRELESKNLNSEELKNASDEELETLLPEYFKNTESKREYIQSLVNKRIKAERSIAKELYDKQNAKYVEQTGIDETDVEFVSSYSPMVITECTEDEIEDIVIQGDVKSIDIHDDVKITSDSDISGAEISATADSYYTTAWKSAIRADFTTGTIGIKGKGVTIGVYDGDAVYKNYYDLKDTDITVLDKVYNYEDYHATKVTRILAGDYGVVPKAKVYAWDGDDKTDEEAIEKLIEKGVSLINMSLVFGKRETDYYTQFEKWLDHVSYMHDVLIVNSAGNVDKYNDENCPIGSLAYNTLTVGGIDTKNTEKYSDDTFHNNTCYANGDTKGCAKPDCEAAYNDVLEETLEGFGDKCNYSGTSFATPAVTGVCAQVIQSNPSLAFDPQITKAIILASCDRKCGKNYANGLTAKEGSGVVNAFKAIVIASTERYMYQRVYGSDSFTGDIDYVKRETNTSKLAVSWIISSYIAGDQHSNVNDANSAGNCNFDLIIWTANDTLFSEIYNSSAEAVVFNSANDTITFTLNNMTNTSDHAYEFGIAWY